jgi:hypothetical protein
MKQWLVARVFEFCSYLASSPIKEAAVSCQRPRKFSHYPFFSVLRAFEKQLLALRLKLGDRL